MAGRYRDISGGTYDAAISRSLQDLEVRGYKKVRQQNKFVSLKLQEEIQDIDKEKAKWLQKLKVRQQKIADRRDELAKIQGKEVQRSKSENAARDSCEQNTPSTSSGTRSADLAQCFEGQRSYPLRHWCVMSPVGGTPVSRKIKVCRTHYR
ncbi:Hypp2482 [Branchiostoma lanceolatum]|uniref:Hypp2482 protein n=1 Tax=Branchiostoma lanceolatum TaxID=7740 RepID=A0A8J9ZTN0_BRALA|nr:Hypp2482 [Branchiostoma lanceolatum]